MSADLSNLMLFTGNAHPELARAVAHNLGVSLGNIRVAAHPDGEPDIQFLEDVRGKHLFILQPTGQPDRNLVDLRLMVMTARRSAARITAVVPYLGYARSDRMDRPRVPIAVEFVADVLANSGIHDLVLFDLHAGQIVGIIEAYNRDLHVDHMYIRPVILDWLSTQDLSNVTISGVDAGGAKWVESYFVRLRKMGFPVESGSAQKSGSSTLGISNVNVLGDFAGRDVYLVDDMVSTATSAMQVTARLLAEKARSVSLIAIHPVLANEDVCHRLADGPITRFITTDTLPMRDAHRRILGDKLTVISIDRLVSQVIRRLYLNQSLSALFELDGYRAG